jgi:hypothetical protein
MNKEFNRMQKLAGLITENMGSTDLDSTASDVYDYFSKKSSSTSTDRRKYIKSLGLSDDDTEMVMMKVTDMMSDDMNENMEDKNLDSISSNVYDYFSKKSSSTSTDRRNYIKKMYKLSDKDTETVMMSVTDMMSDDMNENMGGKNLESVAGDVYGYFIDEPSSTSTERREYIKNTYGLSDDDTETVMMKVTDMMVGDDMREGVAAYEYEKGKKAGEMGMEEGLKRTIRKNQNVDSLRKKIREMILAEMDGAAVEAGYYDPVAEAKKEIEDIDIEDVDVTDEKMIGNDDPKVAEIQDLLNQLQDAAEELGDEKLLTQIGNTITFFTREHVANADNMG